MQHKLALGLGLVLASSLFAACAIDDDVGDDVDVDDVELDLGLDGRSAIYLHPYGDDHAPCTREAPCKSFARANELLSGDKPNVIILGEGNYSQAIVLDHAATIFGNRSQITVPLTARGAIVPGYGKITLRDALLAADYRQSIQCGWGGVALVNVKTNATILCTGLGRNQVELTDSVVDGTIVVTNGDVMMDRSQVTGGTGVTLTRTSYAITNSLFVRMGGPITFSGALGATQRHRFELNTVADNGRNLTGVRAVDLQCLDGAPSEFASNIVWTSWQPPFGIVASYGCRSRYSLVWSYTGAIDPLLDGAYHLEHGSPAIDAADPRVETRRDVDGEPVVGPRADIGADEYVE